MLRHYNAGFFTRRRSDDDRFVPQIKQGFQTLRTKHHAGAKGTPNTPNNLQENT